MAEDFYLKVATAPDLKSPRDRAVFRFFEILPGFLTWATLIGVVVLSWKAPVFIAFFIIFFVVFWLFRTIYLFFHLKSGYQKMKKYEKIDWLKKVKELPAGDYKLSIGSWRDIYHLIVLPMYKESYEIIREGFISLENSDYPKDRMIVVLGIEERSGSEAKELAEKIKKEFGDKFFKLLITCHPKDLPGEIAGKGSNETWAVKKAKEIIIDPLKIPEQNIIVSSFDADTCVFPKYFSCLAYHYLTVEKPTRTSFQPIPLYINNIWQASAFSRIFAFSATFWQTMSQERPEKLITFSSHSMSFKALVAVGFRQTNVVSDDSRIFWQCFFKYDGDYKVQPLFYPISMDANVSGTFLRTMANIYKQQKRWAYGVGDIAYFLFGFLKNKKIPFKKKFSLGFEMIEGHLLWATASIMVFLLGWLPLVLGGEAFSQSVISYNLPRITSQILTITMLGLIFSAYLSIFMLPPKKPEYGKSKYLVFALSWVLLPFMMIFFTSLPAIDAQTRWMFGKYMGFWATEKVRKP